MTNEDQKAIEKIMAGYNPTGELDALKCLLTADFVKVVRCKDCYNTVPGDYGLVCCMWGSRTSPNAFCSYGERRHNENL
jgi:hypothetical protein